MEATSLPLTADAAARLEDTAPSSPELTGDAEAAWSPVRRAGFRMIAIYFALWAFPFPLTHVPWLGEIAQRVTNAGWNVLNLWVARSLLGIEGELMTDFTGSGDRTLDYVALLVTAALALAGAAAWSLLDRDRPHYRYAARWLELGARYVLGLTMLSYGIVKIIPSQFSTPSLDRLVQTYGDSSPMGLLWTFMGASTAYTIFAGLSEAVGGLLVLFRRTRALGALVLAGVLTNVVMLNFAYDVPVKIFSSQLLLVALALLALDGRRLVALFVTNRTAPPAEHRSLFRRRRWNLAGRALAFALVATFVWSTVASAWSGYASWGGGRERPQLWGIYDVESFRADGEELPPLLTDEVRWRALLVDRALPVSFGDVERPGWISIQQMDGSLTRHQVLLDEEAGTLIRTQDGHASVEAAEAAGVELTDVLRYERPEPDRLVIRGRWQDADVEIHLTRRDMTAMELTGRGYHWVNEVPYNR